MTYILKNKTKNRHFDVLKDVVESFQLTYDEYYSSLLNITFTHLL